jgi:hypothetical protein
LPVTGLSFTRGVEPGETNVRLADQVGVCEGLVQGQRILVLRSGAHTVGTSQGVG